MEPSDSSPIGIRRAIRELPTLVDQVVTGEPVVISRRGRPLAALISTADFERLRELERRDEGLQAVFRGQGIRILPWTTPKILEVLTRLGATS